MLGFIILAFTCLYMGDLFDWVIIWGRTWDLEMVLEIRELCSVICRWR